MNVKSKLHIEKLPYIPCKYIESVNTDDRSICMNARPIKGMTVFSVFFI